MTTNNPSAKKIRAAAILFGPLALLCLFLLRPIELRTADLGRHLQNGKLLTENFRQNHDLLFRNFYSATYPDFAFPNHHWGSGVVFYWLFQLGGFSALSLLYIALTLAAFALALAIAKKQASLPACFAAALLAVPLLGDRAEVRPEGFSYFFLALFLYMLTQWRGGKLRARALLALPLLMLIWVNLHIQFILGLWVLGAFLLEAFFSRKTQKENFRLLFGLTLACLAAGICTPLGYHLLLFPLQIFSNYGYRIAENQSLAFFLRHQFQLPIVNSGLIAMACFLGAATSWARRQPFFGLKTGAFWLAAGAGVLGFTAIRNLSILGLVGMPMIAMAIDQLPRWGKRAAFLPGILACALYFHAVFPDGRPQPAIGLNEHSNQAAVFFRQNSLAGPIFNNFDIGGYLIFHLFPQEKLFVDNRPEAYPAAFFGQVYIPMQENPEIWQWALAQYHFNAIFFYRLDMTPEAQAFLIARVQDPEWAPVYVDDAAIILLRRNPRNATAIQKYELPQSLFSVRR